MTLEQLEAQVAMLTAALQAQSAPARSPVVGQLSNLLEPRPSATVAKANYFFEGMNLPAVKGKPYPTLRYRLTDTGVEERCCRNAAEVESLSDEWSSIPPSVDLPSPMESLEEAMATLTDEERQMVMHEQRNVRLSAIKAQLALLNAEDLASVQGVAPPVKRKAGRPRKTD